MKKIAAIVMALTLSGCASIVDSSSQETTINSTPQGARCDLVREGAVIGTVSSTPAKVNYKRRYADAEVVCKKPGYKDTKAPLSSDTNAWTFGNIIFGGLIGWGIDAGTGAMNKYDEAITVTLPAAAPEEKPAPARTLKSKPNS